MTQSPPTSDPLRGRNVLVTGGLGFIGSNVALACLQRGARVAVYDCLDPRSGGNMQNVKAFEGDLEILLNDTRNFEGLSSAVRHRDIIVNCAAYTSHPMSMREPLIDIEVNCKGVINLLEAVRRFNREAVVVHVGTSTQVGRMMSDVVTEAHPEFPVDIYSANKTAAEKYVLVYAKAYGMRATVVRIANNYGPRSNIRSPEFGFMNYFIGLGLSGKDITVFGDGRQLRNISFVDDSVEALLTAATSPAAVGEVFFAVADTQISVSDVAAAIADAVGGRVRVVDWPKDRAAIEIGDAIISNEKIRRVLGWTPRTQLADGLRRTRAYFSGCLDAYL